MAFKLKNNMFIAFYVIIEHVLTCFTTTEHFCRLLRDNRARLWLLNEQITPVYSFLRDHRTRF